MFVHNQLKLLILLLFRVYVYAELSTSSYSYLYVLLCYGLFTPPTRQFCLVRVGGVNTPLEFYMLLWHGMLIKDCC